MPNKFVKNTILFSIATFISRILGYIRDAVIAFAFGASSLTDAFFVAWRLPNTLRQLVAEGSFNAVFIPIYTQLKEKSENEANSYISALFSYYVLILSVITILAVIFSKLIVILIAPGLKNYPQVLEIASNLVKLVFPYLILVGMVSFFMAVLNTKDRFFIPAITPAFLNLSFIICSLLFSSYIGIYSLAVGAILGGITQVLITFFLFKKEGFTLNISFRKHRSLKETLNKIIPSFLSFGVSQFSFIIDTILASLIFAGAISYLYYGNRIFQLPLGIFAIGLGNALLVSLSKHFAKKDVKTFEEEVSTGIKLAIIMSVPAMFGMIILGLEIMEVLFQRGEFSQKDSLYSYYALIGYSFGLVPYAVSRPFKSAFFAIKDIKTPVYATFFGFILGILFALIFVFWLNLEVFGLAFSSSLAGFFSLVYLWKVFPFKTKNKQIIRTLSKSLVASFCFSVVIILVKPFIEDKLLMLGLGIVASIAIYFLILLILKENTIKLLKK